MNLDLFGDLHTNMNTPPFKLPDNPLYSWIFDKASNVYLINVPNGKMMYYPSFFERKICNRTVEYFLENETATISLDDFQNIVPEKIIWRNINWQQDKITMFGKPLTLPRLSSWHGDPGKSYTYSGIKLDPKNWNKCLIYIKRKIEEATNCSFNSVLLNWYRDGNDSISWHADKEQELGRNPIIGSVSFGATRRFILRRIDKHDEKFEISLRTGSLLIMYGEMQHFWQHSIPKDKNIIKSRFNLTFRNIID